jgi:cytoskeletal protein CcmA (bactofilin family)
MAKNEGFGDLESGEDAVAIAEPRAESSAAKSKARVASAPVKYGTAQPAESAVPSEAAELKEMCISAGITIEGRIDGAAHLRVAGLFKGDVHVTGNLTIEPGGELIGSVHAKAVVIGGHLEGSIESAARVAILSTGVLHGDLKAGLLMVEGGSRMIGRVEFGG